MESPNSNINNNVNKDSGNSYSRGVSLKLSDDLLEANIVSEIRYMPDICSLKITFSEVYDKDSLYLSTHDIKKWSKWMEKLESRIKIRMPSLNNRYRLLIENTIHENIDLLLDTVGGDVTETLQENNRAEERQQEEIKQIHLRKYVLDGQLYESVIVDKCPKFLAVSAIENFNNNDGSSSEKSDNNNIQFKLVDRIDVPHYTFYPADSLVTHNPLPYSFESEEELKKYIELAKKENFDSLFQEILKQIRNFVNIEEHVQVILAADTLYSYFQEKFGATHYNIFIGENGSGKNSALLFFKILGYRVFYVTAASPANYYTFLGDIQEGQGTIAEDEADDIGYNRDKQRILKTGYASGGNFPKVEFSKNGSTRSQASYLTFCHKWLAMEELPDEKRIRGLLDRSFIFNFIMGDVKYNIKKVIKDENSSQHKDLVHLRKLLFVFKLLQQDTVFPDIKINIKNRNAELIEPLLRIFYNTSSFEKIQKALSTLINEKTYLKSNSLESKMVETLNKIIEMQEKDDDNKDKKIIEVTNEKLYLTFIEITDAQYSHNDEQNSTFYLPDGTSLSKKKITRILSSKFKAKPIRTREKRGFQINKKDIEKISKQYEVIDEIKVLEELSVDENAKLQPRDKMVTQVTDVTDVTHFKGAIPSSSYQNANTNDQCNGVDDCCNSINNKEDSLTEFEDKFIEDTDTSTSILNPDDNGDKDVMNEPTFEDNMDENNDDQSNKESVSDNYFNERVKQDTIIL